MGPSPQVAVLDIASQQRRLFAQETCTKDRALTCGRGTMMWMQAVCSCRWMSGTLASMWHLQLRLYSLPAWCCTKCPPASQHKASVGTRPINESKPVGGQLLRLQYASDHRAGDPACKLAATLLPCARCLVDFARDLISQSCPRCVCHSVK